MLVEFDPTCWECPPPMGFAHLKAWDKGYHEPIYIQIS
jgi:hypothetical protein